MNQDLESQAKTLSCWPRAGWNLKAYRWRHHLFLPRVSVGFQVVLQSNSCHDTNSPYHPLGPHQWLPCRSCYPVKVGRMLAGRNEHCARQQSISLFGCFQWAQQTWGEPNLPWQKKHPLFDLCTALKSKVMSFFFSFLLRLSAFPWVSVKKMGMLTTLDGVHVCYTFWILTFWSNGIILPDRHFSLCSIWSSRLKSQHCLREPPRNQNPASDQIHKHQRFVQSPVLNRIQDLTCRAVHQVLVASNCHALWLISIQSLSIWDGHP